MVSHLRWGQQLAIRSLQLRAFPPIPHKTAGGTLIISKIFMSHEKLCES